MKNDQLVKKEYFIKRLVDLCLRSGLSGFPVDAGAQNILLKSSVLTLNKSTLYTEKEINNKLEYWINNICQLKGIDQVTLRRMLVDSGYLMRNNDGSAYQVSQTGFQSYVYDEAVELLNIEEVLQNAREEIARRKKEYLEKSGKQLINNKNSIKENNKC